MLVVVLTDCANYSDITAHLRSKLFSVAQVESWKIVSPSFDRLPTVPSRFDEEYWDTYWKIVHEPEQMVFDVIDKMDQERREMENKQMADQKREEAKNLETEKKQEELRLRKRKKIIESPTQSPLSHHSESPSPQVDHNKKKRSMKSPTQSPPSKRRIFESPSPQVLPEKKSETARKETLNPPPVRLYSFIPLFTELIHIHSSMLFFRQK